MAKLYKQETEIIPLIPRPGIPAAITDTRETYQRKLALYLVLTSILFERIAFYSLGNNLIPTLQSNQTVGWTSEHSSTASFIFSGTRYISTLLFAVLSDTKLGRTPTIIIGFVLYLTGYILITINSNETISFCNSDNRTNGTSILDEYCAPWILSTLICTAIGAGTVQANMAVFGAEQIRELKSISQYSDKYFIAVNIADMLTLFIIPYFQIENASYYFYTYLAATSSLILSILLFLIGYRYYIHIKSKDSVVVNCIPVIINAFQSWYHFQLNAYITENGYVDPAPGLIRAISYSFNAVEGQGLVENRPRTFLDYAKAAYNGKFPDRIVDDVKAFGRVLIVFILLIPYWLVYSQLTSTFIQQGEKMKLPSEDMPIVWMTLGDPITILFGIIILDTFVYQYLVTWKKETIIVMKFILGMIFACLTMCVAGIVEIFRQKRCIGSDSSNLSIYTQVPQNILMGLSELFAMIASYEFAYFAAPRSAQSLFMSLRFVTAGTAAFLSILYSNTFLQPANVDPTSNCFGYKESWRYPTYFFILATIQLLFILIIIICYKKSRIFQLNPQQLEATQFIPHPSTPSNIRL